MSEQLTRRTALKLVATSAVATTLSPVGVSATASDSNDIDPWLRAPDRVWLGAAFWANPMEDWQLKDGAAECVTVGARRSVHSLTHALTDPAAGFAMSVEIERYVAGSQDGGAGFCIGSKSEIDEYRSNCFARNGVNAGIVGGQLVLGAKSVSLPVGVELNEIELHLSGRSSADGIALTLEARASNGAAQDAHKPEPADGDPTGGSPSATPHIRSRAKEPMATLQLTVPADAARGNVSLVSNFGRTAGASPDRRPSQEEEASGSRYRFRRWTMQGEAFTARPERRFGPILWSMYSLSDSRSEEGFVLKLSALTAPMDMAGGANDDRDDATSSHSTTTTNNHTVQLVVRQDGEWHPLEEAPLDADAWVATFRIPNWDATGATPFRLVYQERHRDGSKTPAVWEGTIQANPVDRPLRMAAMTCQNDYAFPYEPVANNVAKLKPDLVFFSGDQIYESNGGFGIIREPADKAILCYLRKFYQFGWAFRDVMRQAPTLCLPDDHDVLQGNLWGEGGAPMRDPNRDPGASLLGGYVEPARVVNAVHRTNCAHHPDPFDATPAAQGIGVYYGDMVYGGVSFAIIADRQWKSDPDRVQAIVGKEYSNDIDPRGFDQSDLALLGDRQEAFLRKWAEDWRGHALKAVLSQTLFSCLSTHQPRPDRYLRFDFDSNSWPQTPRNTAIDIIRTSKALHICGDTHLTTLSQYGVSSQRDSNWAFCTPAIAAGWPRWWLPDELNLPHANRPHHGLPNTGEYSDAFGNQVYVFAVGNPEVGRAANRYKKAQQKGSGFGWITFDSKQRTYTVEAYRFLVDVQDGKSENQFPGWPVTIHQDENSGQNRLG